jgi:hypothetical protein
LCLIGMGVIALVKSPRFARRVIRFVLAAEPWLGSRRFRPGELPRMQSRYVKCKGETIWILD